MSAQSRKTGDRVRFEDILNRAMVLARPGAPSVAVAGADDAVVLDVLCEAARRGFAVPVLYGSAGRIRDVARRRRLALDACRVVDVKDAIEASRLAVQAARAGEADVLMKGNVTTATLVKAALDPDKGIKTDRLMSHVAVFEVDGYGRVMLMSDGGIVIDPDLSEKVEIVKNAVHVAHALGLKMPKVALLSAIEIVNLKMKSAVEASIIAKMAERGQIKGAVVDGPLALDNAVSPEAAETKGISSPVAGRADVLIVGHADVGNVLFKSLTHFVGKRCKTAGVIVGGKVPMVVVSRADTYDARLNSIAVACILSKIKPE